MKKATLLAVAVLVLGSFLATSGAPVQPSGRRHVSGLLFAQQGEGVTAKIINVGVSIQSFQVVIYQDTAGGPRFVVFDSGVQQIDPGQKGGGGFSVPLGVADEFSVEIFGSSEEVISLVRIGEPCAIVPCVPPRLKMSGSQLKEFKVVFP